MVTYINAPYYITFDIERSSEVASDFYSMNGFAVDRRELVNLVCPQARIEGPESLRG